MNKPRLARPARIEPLEARIAPAFVTGTVNLAGLNGTNGSAFHGAANNDYAGRAVSAAGDVNGDGFGDFIVGAIQTNVGPGAAYVIFGTASGFPADATLDATFLDGDAGFTLVGKTAALGGGEAGISMSAAGDVNGDGFGDVIVGAIVADGAVGASGVAYVVFGKASGFAAQVSLDALDGSDGFALNGATQSDNVGGSVSGAGDVNGDGFDDVIVGASGLGGNGGAYIIYGKAGGFAAKLTLSGLTATQGVQLNGANALDRAGTSVSGVGDFNGDGFADVIVGASDVNGGGTYRGAAYVVLGGSNLGTTIQFGATGVSGGNGGYLLQGVANNDYAGSSVSGAGDVNGDGLADVIVGALGVGPGGSFSSPGAAYVVFGSATPYAPFFPVNTPGVGFTLDGAAGDVAGNSVKIAGDVNGDGIDDLIVGASQNNVSGGTGVAYVVFGRTDIGTTPPLIATLDGSNGFTLAGEEAGSQTGRAVSGAGDVNGDGFADLLVGAFLSDDGGMNRGQAYLVYGGPSGVFITPTIAANGKTATWTDVDGDLVTLKVSVGTLDAGNFELLANSATDSRARLLTLHVDTPEFKGANVSITAKRAGGGDGKVNVGVLGGSNTDLGAVTIGGDLDHIFAGDDMAGLGLKSLTVDSIGAFGGRTADTGIRYSIVAGGMGALKVAGDMAGGNFGVFRVSGAPSGGDIASVTIGGSLLGGETSRSGQISAADRIGAVKISGDVRGGAGERSAAIDAGSIGSLAIGGSLLGGTGDTNARVSAFSIGSITIGGSQVGGAGANSGSFFSYGNIGKVTIKGDQLGGAGIASGLLFADSGGNIASVTIGGDVRGGRAAFSGGILADGTLGPVSVKGDVLGTAEQPFFIRGGGPLAGTKSVAIASLKVGGDFERVVVLGGYTIDNEGINGHAQIGAISVGGDWIASSVTAGLLTHAGAEDAAGVFGNGDDAFIADGPNGVVASIKSVTIKGAARGTFAEGDRFGIVAEMIGSVSIGGVKVPLTKSMTADPANDVAGFAVGATPDFVVREISRTAAPPVPFPPLPVPGAGPRSAFPAAFDLGMLASADGFKVGGVAADDRAGGTVRSAGDVNGDGFGDFIVGAKFADEGGTDRGAAYVVFGQAGGLGSFNLATLDGNVGFKVFGAANSDEAGYSVGAAGDVNGDGFDDVIVGAKNVSANRGAAYVVFGRSSFTAVGTAGVALGTLDGTDGFALLGAAAGDYAGFGVDGAGDVNGDGFDDVIVGAFAADDQAGAAYIVFGKSRFASAPTAGFSIGLGSLDGTDGIKLAGEDPFVGPEVGDEAGFVVKRAGDVNGDGFDDVLVGAPFAEEAGDSGAASNRGSAYLVFGRGSFAGTPSLDLGELEGTAGVKFTGAAVGDRAGYSASGAGDVNGDGFDDVIIGAVYAGNTGAAWVIFGRSAFVAGPVADFAIGLGTLPETHGFKLSGIAAGDKAGFSVSGAGDMNGDGFADLLVGASRADEGGTPPDADRGAAYIVFGKAAGFGAGLTLSALDGSNGFKLSGAADGDRTAFSVSDAGDVNGDGFADVIVGAVYADGAVADSGAAYVIYGGPSGEFIDPTISADGKTATWTDVDGDLVTLKVSKGTLDAGNFSLLAKSTDDHRAQLLLFNVSVVSGTQNPEFDGADITLTAKRAGGGDGKVNLGFLNAANVDLGAVKISGDLGGMYVGDSNDDTGLKSLTLGSVRAFGGRTQDTGGDSQIFIAGPAGPVKIAGDFAGGAFSVNTAATAGSGKLASLTIGGSLIGGPRVNSGSIFAEVIGAVKIGGDQIGGAGASSGHVLGGVVGSFTLGGSMIGGSGIFSSGVQSFGTLGNVTIGGSQIGGRGDASAAIFTAGNIGKVSIAGDQAGGGIFSAIIFANGADIASVTIGGDVRSGSAFLSGGILAGRTAGPVTIKGDVIGTAENPYTIRGSGPLTGTTSVAITSVKVGGDFDHALILAGYGSNNAPENGHAQIGAISVGGDWIASSVTAGLLPFANATGSLNFFGNGDDVFINAGPAGVVASIASITIKGRAMGSLETGDFYGIVAEQIGFVKLGKVKLTFPGAPDPGFNLGLTPDFAAFEVARA